MSQNGQTHFKNLAANAARFLIKGLRRCNTIKTCRWNLFKFSWVVHYRKIYKNFKWENYGGTELVSEKSAVLYAELNEKAEAVTDSYSVTGAFYSIFILCLWLRIGTSDQGV